MKFEKKIHSGYTEFVKLTDYATSPMFEKWQYFYMNEDGVSMDMIQFTPRMYGSACWEIYGGPLEDVERYRSKAHGEMRILFLLYGKPKEDELYN